MEVSDNHRNTEDVPSSKRSTMSKITVEPIVFLSYIARSMILVVTDNLLQEKICEKFYHGSKANCTDYIKMFNGTRIVDAVQEDASDYNMYISCITTLPAIILVTLLGPWSDRHGRKVVIMLPLLGGAISSIICALVSATDSMMPQYILISKIPNGISGGHPMLMMSCFSYLSDVTGNKDRTVRMAVLDGVLTIAMPMGTLIGGQIYAHYSYAAVYFASTACYVFTLIYVFVCIVNIKPDKLNDQQVDSKKDYVKKSKCSDVFHLDNILDNFRVCFKQREGNLRTIILLLLLGDILNAFPIFGEFEMLFLYTRKRYGWDVTAYSYFQAYFIAVSSVGMFFLMPILSRKLHIKDSVFGLLGNSVKFIGSFIKTFSYKAILLWIAGGTELIAGFAFVVNRAMLSKCVPATEIGKVFAVDGIITALVPTAASIVYSQTYKLTLATFPGAVFLITATASLAATIIFCYIHYSTKKNPLPK